MKEWPLTVFTLATQVACGLAMAATVGDAAASPSDAALMSPLAIAIFPILTLGIVCSLGHLGRPLLAWKALANLRRSALSREVALIGLFALMALAYGGLWWMGRADGRVLLGAATSAAGMAAVLAGSAVYAIPARPDWNSGWVALSFAGTAVVIGSLASALMVPWMGESWLSQWFLIGAVVGGALVSTATVWMAATLSRPSISRIWFRMVLCLVAAGILPILTGFGCLPTGGVAGLPVATVELALVTAGAAAGRAAMFDLAELLES